MNWLQRRSPDLQSLTNKVVLVTGAGSGIGAATATELMKAGAIPVLVDCDEAGLHATKKSLGADVLTICSDVSSASDCELAVLRTLERYGRIDIVWANAGIAAFGPLLHTDPAAWRRCMEVNVFGVFNTVRAALPSVVERKGYVLVSASVSSFAHPPGISAYAASKSAVEAMCNAWRIELAAHGVSVGVMHASWVKTALMDEGGQHPGFVRLRQTMPWPLSGEITASVAAGAIVRGMQRRARQIWAPSWVRCLHWLRPFLHTRAAETALIQAAPEIEALCKETIALNGLTASSFPPRELARQHDARRIGNSDSSQ